MVGDVCWTTWSTTQGVGALSSGEAEYHAAIKGAIEGLDSLVFQMQSQMLQPSLSIATECWILERRLAGDSS